MIRKGTPTSVCAIYSLVGKRQVWKRGACECAGNGAQDRKKSELPSEVCMLGELSKCPQLPARCSVILGEVGKVGAKPFQLPARSC